MMFHIECLLLQPLWKFNLGDRIGDSLQNSRDADHFLDLCGEPLKVIIPIEYFPYVYFSDKQAVIFSPLEQKFPLDLHIGIEYLGRDGSLSDRAILRIA